ncbi:MAG: S-ribosylhomocysteine lyase [Oscillospiraceae bacterium]|nr:S-ribosylhomocysteine lyase [Oscillospiraceae bacterium]
MNRITSFSVDHDFIEPGIYISRVDGDITTFDMRTRKPNAGDYMDNITMHTVEHMFATYVRNSDIGDSVIYFGPMGCRTGFYLLTRGVEPDTVRRVVFETLEKIIAHEGEVFGASRKECGNYLELDLESAKIECRKYLGALKSYGEIDFKYPGERSE